ncbi:hypothetical protein PbB2_02237 [Candidatus Phycosocius bacilliformis]|uniref:Nudix hydrolase domain-containing protein n=1 Tax=Candidatus Phycosocius bacilliformis TaxID=1445552 RepID=A0A2P2EBY4_9PROT|nr:NUDIX domain-containing protein [Candidatus Phycosocius bacilliformis]GBF58551.1 hypothetical protein PbB2_02237 [Candidatus Phycosocius bacilliformis]
MTSAKDLPDLDPDGERDLPYRPGTDDAPRRAPRPKDAATLILVRDVARAPEILMGRRASGHSFMPDKYVFPGGKVDRCDRFIASHDELSPRSEALLRQENPGRHPRAFALAAIRETWEETGLVVGRPGRLKGRMSDAGWASFMASGHGPHLSPLHFFARAITPPQRHKRFDARFFIAHAEEALVDQRPARDGAEMEDLRWFSLADAFKLDLPNVTRFILGEVQAWVQAPEAPQAPAFLRWGRQGPRMDRL